MQVKQFYFIIWIFFFGYCSPSKIVSHPPKITSLMQKTKLILFHWTISLFIVNTDKGLFCSHFSPHSYPSRQLSPTFFVVNLTTIVDNAIIDGDDENHLKLYSKVFHFPIIVSLVAFCACHTHTHRDTKSERILKKGLHRKDFIRKLFEWQQLAA